MPIEEIVLKSTIDFPKPLNWQKIKKLFTYIAGHYPCDINYNVETNGTIYGVECKGVRYNVSFLIHGTIVPKGEDSSLFHLKQGEPPFLSEGIKFDTIPGYRLTEHRDSELAVWDRTRELVKEYFEGKR